MKISELMHRSLMANSARCFGATFIWLLTIILAITTKFHNIRAMLTILLSLRDDYYLDD